jgi:hypothetical protein
MTNWATENPRLTTLLIITIIVTIIVIYGISEGWYSSEVTVVVTTSKGATNPENPQTIPNPTGSSTGEVAGTGNVSVPRVKTIRIEKITSNDMSQPSGENNDWKTFQIGEVIAFSNGEQLKKEDYASAKYNMNSGYTLGYPALNAYDGNLNTHTHTDGSGLLHQLDLKLNEPKVITKVDVYNRHDCCQSRLNGSHVILLDNNNQEIARFELTGQRTVQVWNTPY